jgi:hypothetical protein
LAFSSKERETTNEGGIQLPPHPSYGRLKKGGDEKILNTQLAPSLRRRNKSIGYGKKENNTKKST